MTAKESQDLMEVMRAMAKNDPKMHRPVAQPFSHDEQHEARAEVENARCFEGQDRHEITGNMPNETAKDMMEVLRQRPCRARANLQSVTRGAEEGSPGHDAKTK